MEAPKRILIVDDEKDFLFSASLALRKAGYDVLVQESAVKAIELMRREIDLTMGQIGCPSLDQLGEDFLWRDRPDERRNARV